MKWRDDLKIAFIVPYFGQFRNYFQLFLNSCEKNPNVTWLIFTDNRNDYDYPNNVKVFHITFDELRKKFQKKFDFPIILDTPYKLCDYKPSYGYVFEDYIKGYDAWGYCDTDLIWGDISKFLSKELLNKYDKIGDLGHCTVFKNTYEINRMFMNDIDGIYPFKKYFSVSKNNSFDEEYKNSVNNIFNSHGYKILPTGKMAANIYTKSSNFKLTYLDKNQRYKIERKSKNIFVWKNGKLLRFVNSNNKISKEEFLYLHLQSRNMKININNQKIYKIIPNSFDDLDNDILDPNNFPKVKHMNLHYFRLRTHNLNAKIRYRLFGLKEK